MLLGCASRSKTVTSGFVTERDLIVFVGKKLSVEKAEAEPDCMDHKFDTRYRVLQLIHGEYDGSEIKFVAYDHYGYPKFAKFEHVLLFVSRDDEGLYHEKYQFFDVYPTKDGRWASCGDPYKREPKAHRGTIKSVKIDFAVKTEDNGALCAEGNFVEDLFLIKKEGVLKARGLFK